MEQENIGQENSCVEDSSPTLLQMVKEATENSLIEIEDLAESCETMEELSDTVMISCRKNIKIIARKQPWFNMHKMQSPLITIIELAKLNKKIKEIHPQ